MLRDSSIFMNPDAYLPERWLAEDSSSLPDPINIAFGFGTRCVYALRFEMPAYSDEPHRICSGRYLADRIGFSVVAAVMSLYDILPLEGEERPKSAEYLDSSLR